jgi:hypothetical protein
MSSLDLGTSMTPKRTFQNRSQKEKGEKKAIELEKGILASLSSPHAVTDTPSMGDGLKHLMKSPRETAGPRAFSSSIPYGVNVNHTHTHTDTHPHPHTKNLP